MTAIRIPAGRVLATALVAISLVTVPLAAARADTIYDSHIVEQMTFTPAQLPKVRAILSQTERTMVAIFNKYGIDPHARPDFDKLMEASTELQAAEANEKREMKAILSKEQYKHYLKLLQVTAARVIKATRNDESQ